MKLNQLAQCLALVGLSAHLAAMAQDVSKLQRVEITGSSIKRIAAEGALPLQIITRGEIDRAGIATAEQLISTLNINGNGLDNLASNADVVDGAQRGNNGATSANLRGQGASSTLVLLNGRRVAAHGLNGAAVDLNSIPFAAVERIEILKDGASAIYGTDAIGGVINFILRRDYRGLEANAFMDATEAGGGNIVRASLTGGFGDIDKDGFNVLASLTRSDNKLLRGNQRDFVNTFQPERGLSVDTRGTPYATAFAVSGIDSILSNKSSTGPIQPGTTQQMSAINVLDLPGQKGCGAIDGQAPYDEKLWDVAASKWACAWDTGRAAVLQQPVTNTNLVLRGTLKLGEHLMFGEVVAGKSESAKSFSPNQVSSSGSASSLLFNLTYPSTGAAYNTVFNEIAKVFPTIQPNFGKGIAYRWRCMECGNREIATESDTGRFLIGAEGPMGLGNWDYKVGLSQAFSKSSSVLGTGYYYTVPFVNMLKSGIMNVFLAPGETQSQAAMNALAATSAAGVTLYGGKFTMTEVDASASGSIMKLPAGDLMAAVGVDVRREEYRFNGDQRDLAARQAILNAPFDDINALGGVSRNIKAVYGELLVPITKKLEATLAVRRDDYTGFGDTTNPKVTLRFTPFDELLMRGSYSTGFRVPTFNQLFNGVTISPYSGKDLVDPAKCATGKVDASKPGCESITPDILTGGKTTLGPEESKQATFGIVWAPNAQFSANLDWWYIKKEGTIQTLALTDMVKNFGLFPEAFFRDGSGNLVGIDRRWINAGESVTKGVEVVAKINGQLAGGKWAANLDGAYLIEKKSRLIVNAPFGASEVGVFSRAGDLGLRWKHTISLSYAKGPWIGTVSQTYRDGYKDYVLPGVASGLIVPPAWKPDVASYTTYNASASYTGFKNLTLTAGIKNLFDKDPPFSVAYDSNLGSGSSWEPRVADPRGRSFTLMANYKFF